MTTASLPSWVPMGRDDARNADELVDEDGNPLRETTSTCRCAECCRKLIIEVSLTDAEREPKIKELGSSLYTPAELTESGQKELEGYLLNKVTEKGGACVFLDDATSRCKIYDTRPLICRRFDCNGAGREQLVELGILPLR